MSDSEDDAHFCLRCKGTFIGLEHYIEHRKVKCKRENTQSITNYDLQFTKTSNECSTQGGETLNIPSSSDTSNRGSWTLDVLPNSSPSVKEDTRLEDVLQPDLLEMNRKDEILDTFLPSHDNDPCLNAVDFFSILELQSSKSSTFQDIQSTQKSQTGMVTRSKTSAVLQAKKTKEPFSSKSLTPDYEYDHYQEEHSQYVVGRDVIITDDYNYKKDDIGLKERKVNMDPPKSKSRVSDKNFEDDGKAIDQLLFHDVHNEVIINSEGKILEESDSYSEDSEDEEDDDDHDTRRISTGGKWKPGTGDWSSPSYWSSAPPATHTGGKWKPTPPPSSSSSINLPSTSTAHSDILLEPESPLHSSDCHPPPSHTRGKWLPTIDSSDHHKAMYWCGPCNRRLSSQVLFEKHCQSDLHRKRTLQEDQLEEDLSMEDARGTGKREVKRTQAYIDSDLWRKSKRRKTQQKAAASKPDRPRGRGSLQCSVCQCRVFPHLIGKHLVSHFHCRRARDAPELASLLVLKHIDKIVLQAPFQCGLCRFFCNTMQSFLQHWISDGHNEKDALVAGRYSCPFCRVECTRSTAMYQHLLSNQHQESVAIINSSVPIVIQKRAILQCDICDKEFRFNFELRKHSVSSKHLQEANSASDRYQERERCSQCDFVAFSRMSLQRHMTFVHKGADGKFFCTSCDLNFETAAEAKMHRGSAEHKYTILSKQPNDKELSKVCCHCYGMFTGVSELKRHLKEEHPDMAYRCMRCGGRFTLKQELARHVRVGCQPQDQTSTSSALPASYQCSKCAFSSDSEAEQLFHIALHSEPIANHPPKYQCPSCPRVFLKTTLKKHLLSHTGERPYSCGVCGAGFGRKDVLENHVLSVHSMKRTGAEAWKVQPERKKTETCQECGASFYDRSTLQQHRQIHEGKPFKCDEPGCLFAGRSRGDLKVHLQSHGEARPFHCSDCDFSSKTKAQLVRHGRCHLETKTHHCPHCQFTCNSSTHLNRHLRLHTGAKPFHCPHCLFSCNLLENLRKHVLSTKKHPGLCLYTCQESSCSFASNFAKDFRTHLVTTHGQSASTAASYVAGLYYGGDDPKHVDHPIPVSAKRKRRKPKTAGVKEDLEEDGILVTHQEAFSDNPTLASAANPGRPEDLLRTVIISDPTEDVICIQLPAEDGLDAFFTHGDAFTEINQRPLFDSLHRNRTISLGESAVMPLGSEEMEDHERIMIIDEGMEEVQPSSS